MYFKVLLLLVIVVPVCWSTDVDFSNLKCQGTAAPANGKLNCKQEVNSQAVRCQLVCNRGYDVKYLAAVYYVCHTNGTWTPVPSSADSQWPDCKIYADGEPVP